MNVLQGKQSALATLRLHERSMMLIQNSMVPQPRASVFAIQTDLPVRARPKLCLCKDWVAACTQRLIQLRPDQAAQVMASQARALWPDVAAFDPVIAAEMEYETWLAGDHAGEPAPVGANL